MPSPFGTHLKHWRKVRRMSQLDLSLRSGVTPRHVSFIETGRSRPGHDVVLRLAEALDVPLRDRNDLLRSAGLPAHYPEATLSDEALAPFRRIVEGMLERHAPYPAFVLDRWWNLVDANPTARLLFLGGRELKDAPLNALDWMLEPAVREMVENWPEVVWSSIHRLRREIEECGGDERLEALLERALDAVAGRAAPPPEVVASPAVCTVLRVGDRRLSVVSSIARFGSAREVTLDELRVELVFPADEATDAFFRALPT